MTADQTHEAEGVPGPQMPPGRGYQMRGSGATTVPIAPQTLWDIVMDPARLAAAIPGAETLRQSDAAPKTYAADVGIGVGRLKAIYRVTAEFADLEEPRAMVLFGGAKGRFGESSGEGWVQFEAVAEGTTVHYSYAILIQGMVAVAGGRLLDAAADMLIAKFFDRLAKSATAVG